MNDDLQERVRQFNTMSLPGQPFGVHMGTSYLINDLWAEVQRLRAEVASCHRAEASMREAFNSGDGVYRP